MWKILENIHIKVYDQRQPYCTPNMRCHRCFKAVRKRRSSDQGGGDNGGEHSPVPVHGFWGGESEKWKRVSWKWTVNFSATHCHSCTKSCPYFWSVLKDVRRHLRTNVTIIMQNAFSAEAGLLKFLEQVCAFS